MDFHTTVRTSNTVPERCIHCNYRPTPKFQAPLAHGIVVQSSDACHTGTASHADQACSGASIVNPHEEYQQQWCLRLCSIPFYSFYYSKKGFFLKTPLPNQLVYWYSISGQFQKYSPGQTEFRYCRAYLNLRTEIAEYQSSTSLHYCYMTSLQVSVQTE